MYYLGIDIAKFKHDCCLLGDYGEVIGSPFTIENNIHGFNSLLEKIKSLPNDKLRIGFESTGHYAFNLKMFLSANGYTFMELNALLVSKKLKSNSLRKTKTDPKDALAIAKLLPSIEYKPYSDSLYQMYDLKRLTRLRNNLIGKRSKVLVEITNTLDHVFPEFKPFFNHRLGSTAFF